MASLPAQLLSGRTLGGPVAGRMTIDGREYINFFGAGYLALAGIPEIRDAVRQALDSGASFADHVPAGLGGIDPLFEQVERLAAAALGTESCVYFASGYLIGAVGIAAYQEKLDVIVLDEIAHYNLRDAAKQTGLPIHTFAHADADSVSDVLKRHVGAQQRPLVVTDGVFTTGHIPPLAEYAELVERYDGRLFVDESHSFGVIGKRGRGAAEYCGVEHLAPIGATMSKAYCGHGAILGCTASQAARLRMIPPVRGCCAGSPLSAAASAACLRYVAERPDMRQDLRAMGEYMRARLRSLGLQIMDTPAPIVAFRFGDRADMEDLARRMFAKGIHIYHSTHLGTGPDGMIRCSLFRDHTRADIDAFVDAFG
jgi:8-amino-7-oxononanoate synthase